MGKDLAKMAWAFEGHDNYEITSVKKGKNGWWEVSVIAKEVKGWDICEIANIFNGYDKSDYFSVKGIGSERYGEYLCYVERVRDENKKDEERI